MQAADTHALAPSLAPSPPRAGHRIQPSRGLIPVDVHELWRFRALAVFFLLRDIKTRYRQTYLGPGWAILRPLMTIIVFSAIFGGFLGISPGANVPYPLWVTPAVLAMAYFSSALTNSSGSLVTNRALISKVYFPRLYVPLVTTLTPLVDLVLGVVVLLGLFLYFHRVPSWHVVFLPAFLALTVLIAAGLGLWVSAFTARYRDLVFALPFALQIWQYLTPVIYPAFKVPSAYRPLLSVNPLTAVMAGFRWSILGMPFNAGHGGAGGNMTDLITSIGVALAIAVTGLFFYRRSERTMADLL